MVKSDSSPKTDPHIATAVGFPLFFACVPSVKMNLAPEERVNMSLGKGPHLSVC
jgi:hypothetical protein